MNIIERKMHIKMFVLLMGLVSLGSCWPFQFDYTLNHTLVCNTVDNDWTFQEDLNYLWGVLVLHDIDKLCFLIACPIIMAIQLIIIGTFIKYKGLLRSPGDMFLGLILSQFGLNTSLLVTAIYNMVYTYNNPMPDSFPAFCMTTAFVNSILQILEEEYMTFFLVRVIASLNKSIKKKSWFQAKWIHFLFLAFAVVVTLCFWGVKWLGLSQFGICQLSSTRNSYKQFYFPILKMLFEFLFICLAGYTYFFLKKLMPKGQSLNRKRYEQNEVVTRFTIGQTLFIILFSTALLVIFFNCQKQNPNPLIMIFSTVFNLTRIAQFFYLIYVIVHYKRIGNKVKKFLRRIIAKILRRNSNAQTKEEIKDMRLTDLQKLDCDDIGLKQKVLDIQQDQNQIDFIKITQIITILAGVSIAYKQYFKNYKPQSRLKPIFYEEEVSFKIGPKMINQYKLQVNFLPRLSVLEGTLTMYAPRVFHALLVQDGLKDIQESFQILKNSNQIYRVFQSDGGRSGEFFFFTSDNKYILKTVASQQFQYLLAHLQDFYEYQNSNPDTLITKIYGLFTVKSDDIYQQYHILLMKNISACLKYQILRTYDLKGSKYDRQAMKDDQSQETKKVLKDIDFLKLEGKIDIEESLGKELRMQLEKDTSFLKNLNIIDYSLLVMRVHWHQPPLDSTFWSKYQRIPSIAKENEFYHIVLIDFLQRWDIQKKGQKWWKNMFGKKDTSAQQPSFYQSRFMSFIKEITSSDSFRGDQSFVPTRKETQLTEIRGRQIMQ